MTTVADPGMSAPASAGPAAVASLLRAALALHQGGHLTEAEEGYRRILAAQPRHFDSLHLLGVIYSQRREHAAAVQQIDAAIAVNPDVAAAHNNRGVSLNALGQHRDALASFERATALAPDYVDAWQNRANALLDLGCFEDAVPAYERAIALRPDAADLFLKRGHALTMLNRLEPAIDSYDRAIARAPNDREARFNRAIALASLGRFADAAAGYDGVIALNPNDAQAFSNRGAALKALRRFDEALASCDRAIALDPELAVAYGNRGAALKELNRLEEALASCDTAIRLMPASSEAAGNRANVLAGLGRYDEAIAGYAQAIALDPDDATARSNGGMVKLLTGRFEEGWADYEARWQIGQMAAERRRFRQPQWIGDTDIRGKRVLLLAEQGLGDTIMMLRYVRDVVDRGAAVIVELPATLRSLLASVGDRCEIVTQGEPLPDFDLYCPLLSLPRAFGTTLVTIPAEVPYLAASPACIAAWRDRLAGLSGLRVGLVWAGNPQHINDQRRSIDLRALLPWIVETEASIVSLQKELRPGDVELLRAHPQVTHIGGDLASYEDTAAVLSVLDLAISVDTSVSHLAGALGRPVWILLPRNPDWRWLLDREDTPWYPTGRLFRQSLRNDWTDVFAQVAAEIRRLARACHAGVRPVQRAPRTD